MKRTLAYLLSLLVFAAAGCGDDDAIGTTGTVIGGPCVTAEDCALGSLCASGGDFAGGTCTVPCRSDADCAPGTACVQKNDGICLLSCTLPRDCRPGYSCQGEERVGIAADALVCITD